MLDSALKLRLLPVTIVACSMFLGVKIDQIIEGKQRLDNWGVSQAIAQDAAPPAEATPKPAAPAAPAADNAPSGDATSSAADTPPADAAKTDTAAKDEMTLPQLGDTAESETADQIAPEDKREFNQIELDILQSLSARREEIEKWSEEVEMKENLLQATELRINDKINQLQSLKGDVEALLARYDKQEQVELRSLVKIYENMKPKQAARIFDEMEMGILLDVVDMMSERKAAPILASMAPIKAKDLTVELAEKRRLRQETQAKIPEDMNAGAAPPAPPSGNPPAETPAAP